MKKTEKTELTKERILKAAVTEFGEKGYAAASLNTICAAGIPKGLLYHNYENKDALYLACVGRCFDTFTEYLRKENEELELKRYMDSRLRFFRENWYEARIFFEVILHPPVSLKKQIGKLRGEFDNFNYGLYSKLLSSISLRADITREDAMGYFLLMQDMFNGYFSSPVYGGMAFSEVVEEHEINLSRFMDFMLYGIAERGGVR